MLVICFKSHKFHSTFLRTGAELQTSSKSDTTADDIDSESINRAFLTPGQEVSVKIPILAKIKPTYQ